MTTTKLKWSTWCLQPVYPARHSDSTALPIFELYCRIDKSAAIGNLLLQSQRHSAYKSPFTKELVLFVMIQIRIAAEGELSMASSYVVLAQAVF